jgi:LysR family hydrogen peroxide-inducible transcriptional activator
VIGNANPLVKATLIQIRSFVAVCQFEHFGEAAAQLGVSQPTLSQSLAELERGLGLQLVERTTRRVLITDDGRHLLPFAQRVVAAADNLLEAASARSGGPARIRFGAIPTIAPYLVGGLVRALSGTPLSIDLFEHPTASLLDGLTEGSIDVACLALPVPGGNRFTAIPLYREPFSIAVPANHPWAGRRDVDPAELNDQRLVVLEEGHCLRDETLALCSRDKTREGRQTLLETSTIATMVQLVATDFGVTVLPQSAIPSARSTAEIAFADFTAPTPHRDVALLYRKSSAAGELYRSLAHVIATVSRGMPVLTVAN